MWKVLERRTETFDLLDLRIPSYWCVLKHLVFSEIILLLNLHTLFPHSPFLLTFITFTLPLILSHYHCSIIDISRQQWGPLRSRRQSVHKSKHSLSFFPLPHSSYFSSTGFYVSIVLSSHFHLDPSEAWHCLVASTLMEVYPAARKEGRRTEGEEKGAERRKRRRRAGWLAEESLVEPRAL